MSHSIFSGDETAVSIYISQVYAIYCQRDMIEVTRQYAMTLSALSAFELAKLLSRLLVTIVNLHV